MLEKRFVYSCSECGSESSTRAGELPVGWVQIVISGSDYADLNEAQRTRHYCIKCKTGLEIKRPAVCTLEKRQMQEKSL